MCTHLSPGYFSRVWYLCVFFGLFFFLWGGGVHVTISPGEKKKQKKLFSLGCLIISLGGGGGIHI